jgi:hypothetical protein
LALLKAGHSGKPGPFGFHPDALGAAIQAAVTEQAGRKTGF